MAELYDIVIIGGGPAGLAAGIYASRARMKVVLLEKAACGGKMLMTETIENFPGFPVGIKGPELADAMLGQARAFGLEIKTAEAAGITLKKGENPCFEVGLSGGDSMEALSIVIATGARWNTLGVPGEKELTGRGVSYCATCDGPLFRKKDVIVVGGGDTALEDALFLARFANKVTVVHRRDRLRAARILQERAGSNSSIEFCLSSAAERIIGRNKVEGLEVRNVDTNEKKTLKADGVFILIGVTPNSEIVKDLVKLCPKGYVITDDDMRSSAEGIFACGDARMKLLRQIVTAAGEGATAATSAQHYVERLKGIEYK